MNGKALEERLWRFVPTPVRVPSQVVARAVSVWISEGGPQYGAALAFYSMFALAPLLVLAIWLAGMVFGAEAARGHIVGQIESMVGQTAAQGIESMIEAAWREPVGNLAGLLAIATLLIGASGVFAQLRVALNAMAQVREAESPLGTFVRTRLMAFALVLGFGLLVLLLLLGSTTLAAVRAWPPLQAMGAGLPALLSLADMALSTAVIALGVAGLLRWLPARPPGRQALWIGAITSAVLFALGKYLISLYLARASVASSYGAAGAFVVVMMWVYYSAQIVLFGASLSHAVDERRELAPRGNTPDSRPSPLGSPPPHIPSLLGGGFRRDPGIRDEKGRGPEAGRPTSSGASTGDGIPRSGAKVLPFPSAPRTRSGVRQPSRW